MSRPYSTPDVFRAIAHPARRRILTMLSKNGTMTGKAIADPLPMQWPTVSRHLLVLRTAGLIRSQRRGTELHYSANTRPLRKTLTFLREMKLVATR